MIDPAKTSPKLSRADVVRLTAGKPTLVVVDMQPRFYRASRDPVTLEAVKQEILGAKARQEPIVVLEFFLPGFTPNIERTTHEELIAALEDERNPAMWSLKFKTTVGGSNKVLAACREFGFGDTHFRICGVNTSACVFHTALGLLNSRPNARIEVIAAAVNDTLADDPWLNYEMVPALRVVAPHQGE